MSDATTAVKKPKRVMKPEHWFCLTGLAPILAIYSYLRFIPIVKTFYMGFFNWSMTRKTFIGFTNFENMFKATTFKTAMVNTTVIAFGMFIVIMPLSLMLANALSKKIKMKGWFEGLYFLPVIMPMVPITVIWKWILDSNYGLLNYFLTLFGATPRPWLIEPNLAVFSVILLTVWKNIGYNMLIFNVGIKGISRELYEAADIDGASGFKSFIYITLPLLKPITTFVSIMTLIKGYNVFSQVYILASDVQGSPSYLVRVIVFDIIENGFRFYKMGYAAAEAMILFLIVFGLTIIQFKISGDSFLSRNKEAR